MYIMDIVVIWQEVNGSKTYLVIQSYGNGTINGGNKTPNNEFKVDKNTFVMEPKTTISDIKNRGYTIVSATKNGKDVMNAKLLGTGTIITIKNGDTNVQYTVIKRGDVDGDGEISAVDLLMVKRYIEKKYNFAVIYKEAAKVNKEAEVTAVDLLRVKRHIEGKTYIEI